MTSIKENAYAKINLYLNVLSRRDDGFHEVKTIMHTVSLCDEITVTVNPSKKTNIRLIMAGESKLPTDVRNLAYRAAELFLSATLITADVTIHLTKSIPVAAGLAGGSSDAAAVLRALNKIYKRPLTDKRLLELAAALGSDVPYCIHGGTALCVGRGEEVERLRDTLALHTVIAISDEYVSTPQAYSRLDELYSNFDSPRDDEADAAFAVLSRSLENGVLESSELYNIFENAILPICSEAERIKAKMKDLGATHSLMSGSGPSVFGIFESREDAEHAVTGLKNEGFRAYYAHTVR